MTEYHPDPSIAPLTIQQLRNIYQQQLDHQRQETQAAQAQVTLLTQQLDNETASRQLLHVRETFLCVLFVCFFVVLYRIWTAWISESTSHQPHRKTGARRKDNKRLGEAHFATTCSSLRRARFTLQIFFFFFFCAPAISLTKRHLQ